MVRIIEMYENSELLEKLKTTLDELEKCDLPTLEEAIELCEAFLSNNLPWVQDVDSYYGEVFEDPYSNDIVETLEDDNGKP